MPPEFVDATVFLGMNSTDDDIRRACASFFSSRLDRGVAISLEQVGKCDHVIWSYPRAAQDVYYPFMDNLHTDLQFDRLGYDERDVAMAHQTGGGVAIADRLLLAMVANRGGTLFTLNPTLLARQDVPVRRPDAPTRGRMSFPGQLESLYQDSLALLIDVGQL